jgi:hypothetical protein
LTASAVSTVRDTITIQPLGKQYMILFKLGKSKDAYSWIGDMYKANISQKGRI